MIMGLCSVPAIAFQSLADRCSAGINPPKRHHVVPSWRSGSVLDSLISLGLYNLRWLIGLSRVTYCRSHAGSDVPAARDMSVGV